MFKVTPTIPKNTFPASGQHDLCYDFWNTYWSDTWELFAKESRSDFLTSCCQCHCTTHSRSHVKSVRVMPHSMAFAVCSTMPNVIPEDTPKVGPNVSPNVILQFIFAGIPGIALLRFVRKEAHELSPSRLPPRCTLTEVM